MRESPGTASIRFAALRQLLKPSHNPYAENTYQPPDNSSRLQAYLTHGVLSVKEVLSTWNTRRGLTLNDHVCQDVLQFEYLRHIWRHRGDGILDDIQKRPAQLSYQPALPADIRMAATGVQAIDEAIRQLYTTGCISTNQHNWIAAYVVHLRKIDWRAGARWIYGHLLDGDLGSINIGWQRIAGTLGQAPIVFNADAMASAPDSSRGTNSTLDISAAELQKFADKQDIIGGEAVRPLPRREPLLLQSPPPPCITLKTVLPSLADKETVLVHPWNLAPKPPGLTCIGILHLPFHIRFPWSEARWHFVLQRMSEICDALWIGDLLKCNHWLSEAKTVRCRATPHPGYHEALEQLRGKCSLEPEDIPDPGYLCASFDIYLQSIRRQQPELFESTLQGQVAKLQKSNRV